MTRERLQKVMAACGVGSRRHCEELIAEGRVEVDGEVVTTPGLLVDPAESEIRCDGTRLRVRQHVYLLLNKPRGVICSNRSAADKPAAIDYAPARYADLHLYTVGRLDVDSEGAIILTNDGELCHVATHPRFEVAKTYRAEIDGVPDEDTLARMRKGIWLAEGRTAEIGVELLKRGRDRSVLEVKLREGKRREVRRLCARFGFPVRRLVRTSIGPIELGRLAPGAVRPLRPDEIAALRASANVVIRLGAPTRSGGGGGGGGSRSRSRGGGPGGSRPRGGGGRRAGGKGSGGSGGSGRGGGERGGASTRGSGGGRGSGGSGGGRGSGGSGGGRGSGGSGGGRGSGGSGGGRGSGGAPKGGAGGPGGGRPGGPARGGGGRGGPPGRGAGRGGNSAGRGQGGGGSRGRRRPG